MYKNRYGAIKHHQHIVIFCILLVKLSCSAFPELLMFISSSVANIYIKSLFKL